MVKFRAGGFEFTDQGVCDDCMCFSTELYVLWMQRSSMTSSHISTIVHAVQCQLHTMSYRTQMAGLNGVWFKSESGTLLVGLDWDVDVRTEACSLASSARAHWLRRLILPVASPYPSP